MGEAQDRGRVGEALAAAYLEMVGCRCVARNVRLAGVEVDLVVDDGPSRVLVEVRVRSRGDYGGAAATILRAKRERLVRAARAGPAHGWATFAALGSHLLHDAGDTAAPTPVLWPLRPARQLGRRYQLAGTLLLTTASAAAGYAASRARARAAACAADGP